MLLLIMLCGVIRDARKNKRELIIFPNIDIKFSCVKRKPKIFLIGGLSWLLSQLVLRL